MDGRAGYARLEGLYLAVWEGGVWGGEYASRCWDIIALTGVNYCLSWADQFPHEAKGSIIVIVEGIQGNWEPVLGLLQHTRYLVGLTKLIWVWRD